MKSKNMGLGCVVAALVALSMGLPGGAMAASVTVEVEPNQVEPGEPVTVTVRVSSEVPIYGYSARLRVVPESETIGTLDFTTSETTWGGASSLIESELRDATFSLIELVDGDLLVAASTSDLSTVAPIPGTRDVLVQTTLTPSPDALGVWRIEIARPPSVLSDGQFTAIAAGWGTTEVFVLSGSPPAECTSLGTGTLAVLVLLATGLVRLRRR